MVEIQNYASFVSAIVVFQLIPGPGTLAILNATARNGTRAGLGAVAGTLLGDFTYMVAAVAGLAAIMEANPEAFRLLQWFGAAYLVWVGLRLLRAELGTPATAQDPRRSGWMYFRQGLAVSLTNPKVVLFFVAFFPLFIRPDAPPSTLIVMMAHVVAISFAYQAGLVLMGNAAARRLSRIPSARRIASRLAGLSLIGFGIKLAAGNR